MKLEEVSTFVSIETQTHQRVAELHSVTQIIKMHAVIAACQESMANYEDRRINCGKRMFRFVLCTAASERQTDYNHYEGGCSEQRFLFGAGRHLYAQK